MSRFIGDFHIHSHFSLATSKELKPEFLDYWARLKGIKVIGTGDFTHPGWTKELREKLIPADQGLYKLKDGLKKEIPFKIPGLDHDVRFMLTAEISNIYKKNGKVRKIHNILFAPDFDTAERVQAQLRKLNFNITSDGRPILGLDSKLLLDMMLHISEKIFFVPAHIWTPWFSVLGDKSGFESIEECYEDLTKYIFAVEMGLSSNPPMNWAVSSLDRFTLIANSDAHSPEKLGRNASIFNTDISYDSITGALKTGDPEKFLGTVNFFPQEGKYHFDGHRNCDICWSPLDTLKHKEICPVCNKKVTVGVLSRVAELADRDDVLERKNRHPFHSLIPLKEVISEITGKGPGTREVVKIYQNLLQKLGSEFDILMNLPLDEIMKKGNEPTAEAIRRMRNGEVYIREGFDGEFGVIKVMHENEKTLAREPEPIFEETSGKINAKPGKLISFDLKEFRKLKTKYSISAKEENITKEPANATLNVNFEQQDAIQHQDGPALVIAGPGTGKTRVLSQRVIHLINNLNVAPENILAVTFTNKAAGEIRERIAVRLTEGNKAGLVNVSTFHAFGLSVLKNHFNLTGRDNNYIIIGDDDKEQLLNKFLQDGNIKPKDAISFISACKQKLVLPGKSGDQHLDNIYRSYEDELRKINAFDLDDMLFQPVLIMQDHKKILAGYRSQVHYMLIDEYQDTNLAQYTMMRLLMPEKKSNICVIGDPNQSIYGFRGAETRYINKFAEDYPEAGIYKLSTSYRCSDRILKASEEIIHGSTLKKNMLSGTQKGVKIKIARHQTDKSEAEFMARTIEQMIGGVRFFSIDSSVSGGDENKEIKSLADFAILCRTKEQFRVIEKGLNDHGIPFQVTGDTPLLRLPVVKDMVQLLQSARDPDNTFLRNKLEDKKITKGHDFPSLCETVKNTSISDAITILSTTCFQKNKNKDQLKKLSGTAIPFGNDYAKFFGFAALGTEADEYLNNKEAVSLMTIHASKGLEFKCVFIPGCEEGIIPYNLFENQQCDVEEEKRLLYVGMTRAEKYLYLSHAESRFMFGKYLNNGRSGFINSIEKELLEKEKTAYTKKEKKDDGQMSLF